MKLEGFWIDANSGERIEVRTTLTRGVYAAYWRDKRGRPDSEALRRDELERMVKRGLLTREGARQY